MAFDEFGDPVGGATAETYVDQQLAGSQGPSQSQSKPSRTWGEWVQYKVTAPFESTLTAVGVSYWLANMLSAGINSRVRVVATLPEWLSALCCANCRLLVCFASLS